MTDKPDKKGFLSAMKDQWEKSSTSIKKWSSGDYPEHLPDYAYTCVMLAGADKRFTVVNSDRSSYTVTFQSPKKEKKWDGKITCSVIPVGSGCKVIVNSNADKTGNFASMNQMAAEGAAGLAINGMKMAIHMHLQKNEASKNNIKEAQPEPQQDMVQQLKELQNLHASGILTDEEFAKAKSKLLG